MPANSEIELNGLELGDFIQAYEAARAEGKDFDLELFLPSPEDPLYDKVQRELTARDLAHRNQNRLAADKHSKRTVWNQGKVGAPKANMHANREISSAPDPADVTTARVEVRIQQPDDLGMGSKSGPHAFGAGESFEESPRPHSDVIDQFVDPFAELPTPGSEFLGFRILTELGRGAFGCVYLAQQRDLASRYVALKVSADIVGESQALAQLQHTNIVPIYSVHRAGRFQAVCMPYFGATTVADLIKHWRERESLPESGKELVSTLCNRKSNTRHMLETNATQPTAADACPQTSSPSESEPLPRVADAQATAILEMLEGLSFHDAVLWIASRLADGLAHAHERGILHRDLKPANVLLTDEGQPMLLDFSVAEDVKLRSAESVDQIGGTVCYMAPEHLEAYEGATRTVDARSDLYSLGIILYEMLTRHEPFPVPKGSFRDVLPQMLAARKGPPPRLRCWNSAISPAAEAIVRRCLEPDPAKRYQSAHELREDLDRQRVNLPLKYAKEPSLRERACKWMRRHPRLASTTSIAALAAILISAAVSSCLFYTYRLSGFEAQEKFKRFHQETKTVQFLLNTRTMDDHDQIAQGLKQGHHVLAAYQVLDNPSWAKLPAVSRLSEEDQKKLRAEMEDLLLVMSRATLAQATTFQEQATKEELVRAALRLNELAERINPGEPTGKALLAQRAELFGLLGDKAEAEKFLAKAKAAPLSTPRDYYLAGVEGVAKGHYEDALPLLQHVADLEPENFWAQLLLGICYDGLSRDMEARACYTTSIALWPEFPWTYFNRGLVYLRQNDFQHAIADFNVVIKMRPEFGEVYMNRALAYQGEKKFQTAIEDLTQALKLGAPFTRIYFMRSRVRDLAGDKDGAREDFAEGLRREPTDEKSWLARGIAKLTSDLDGALADFAEAEKVNRRSLGALQNQAHVLSKQKKNEKAIEVLNREIELYPDYVPARVGRGVLLARLSKCEDARKDADESLARDFGPATQYQVACIFAQTSKEDSDDRAQALHYLSSALRKGYGFDLLEQDKDLDPIRDTPEYREIIKATKALQHAAPKKRDERARP
jgi:eukaryotic-like serine/threonine-protein kinase